MGKPRRSFTPEFKQEAVELCRRTGKSECRDSSINIESLDATKQRARLSGLRAPARNFRESRRTRTGTRTKSPVRAGKGRMMVWKWLKDLVAGLDSITI